MHIVYYTYTLIVYYTYTYTLYSTLSGHCIVAILSAWAFLVLLLASLTLALNPNPLKPGASAPGRFSLALALEAGPGLKGLGFKVGVY